MVKGSMSIRREGRRRNKGFALVRGKLVFIDKGEDVEPHPCRCSYFFEGLSDS